jgi:ribonuclease J
MEENKNNQEESNTQKPKQPESQPQQTSTPLQAQAKQGQGQGQQGQNRNPNQKNPNQQNRSGNKNPNKKRRGPPKFSAKLGNQPWELDIKEAITANKLVHSRALQAYNKINLNTDAKVKITPLGGLGEIGGNFMIMETNTSAIIIDIGMSFPSEDMHGVDILIPDFHYIKKIQDKIDGIVITHGHEDHIGAVAYFFKRFQFPIYATPLPLGMLSNKFDEHGLKKEKKYFKPVEKRKVYKIGDFEVEWMHVTPSIIDASSLAITTEA